MHLKDVIASIDNYAVFQRLGLPWQYKAPMDPDLLTISKEALYALKRAGDWGQVQYCNGHDAVFWTADKMAAFYAYVRRVPFVWAHARDFMSAEDGLQPSWPQFIQYSFVCYK
jgi:hypothetical protein